jgi:dihydrofolate reductase
VIAAQMNGISKIVISRTLDKADWNNTRLIKDNVAEEITRLKQQLGKDLAIFGSANLTASLMQLGLVDEFRIMVNPIVLGKGTPLFQGVSQPIKLKLIKTRAFGSGNVLLYYQPATAR